VTEHDQHSSFIKTPQQLIVVILLAFLVPIIGIILLVQLVMSKPGADPNALSPESVAARIQPVGRVEFGAPAAAAGSRTGESIVKTTCAACHQAGVANAPKIGDAKAWAPPIQQGLKNMLAIAIKGKGAMPPRGGDASLTDEELTRAIVFMANQSGAKFKEPAAPKAPAKPAVTAEAAKPAVTAEAAKPQAPKPQAKAEKAEPKPAAPAATAAGGKAVYDKVCFACHAQSVAGSPRLGDKEAWAPRIKQGADVLLQSVIKGKGAMPPKAGNPALTDAEIWAAVEFMISQSK
jgi:cytochrome c5